MSKDKTNIATYKKLKTYNVLVTYGLRDVNL